MIGNRFSSLFTSMSYFYNHIQKHLKLIKYYYRYDSYEIGISSSEFNIEDEKTNVFK